MEPLTALPAERDANLDRQLFWYVSLRMLVLFCILLPYVLSLFAPSASLGAPAPTDLTLRLFGQLFGVTCAAAVLFVVLRRLLPRRGALQAYVQFAIDLLLVSWMLYHFGSGSPFTPLYLVIIIVASAMLGQNAGFSVATAAYLIYLGLQVHFATGLPNLGSGRQAEGWPEWIAYSLLVNMVGFYGGAFLTSRLTRRALRAEGALEVEREGLEELKVVHQDVVESIGSGICTTDRTGRITMLNRTGREILALGEAQLLGQPIQELGLLSAEKWNELTRSSVGRGGRMRSEVVLDHGDEEVFLGYHISPLTDSEDRHRGYIVVFQDLTRWRRLEEEMRLKDRMAAVGEMAAGLAHEIGNPLAAISGSVQMLSQSASQDEQEKKLLGIVFRESQRLDRTIKGFLRFARPRERTTVDFDIGALLTENVELLANSPELREGHRVELDLDAEQVVIPGDPDQITQIFWNLARNALKAMPEQGTLKIRGELQGGVYRMSFLDTGKGMSEEERANLFHPFQSFFDSGTGIGMAIVYRIVQEHGGRIAVDSAPSRGCQIRVELPAVPGMHLAPETEARAPEAGQGAGEGAGADRERAGTTATRQTGEMAS